MSDLKTYAFKYSNDIEHVNTVDADKLASEYYGDDVFFKFTVGGELALLVQAKLVIWLSVHPHDADRTPQANEKQLTPA